MHLRNFRTLDNPISLEETPFERLGEHMLDPLTELFDALRDKPYLGGLLCLLWGCCFHH